MSSSIMHESSAIQFRDVSKVYKLHGSQADQIIDVLGLKWLGLKPKTQPKQFDALKNINLDVPRGSRVGIVGRNGAGKTTLLKLICGNFMPTSGVVSVNGSVQALMNVGLGFHPEYTGRENVEASLQYNGLTQADYKSAIDDIIEFCELNDFFDQPFKSYSLGMQARLMFATATAIKPDILIVDEVLGAGDAYFVAKSKKRVESLINSGCTMLLVSHSMQQVLELCDEVVWLDRGQIRMRGSAFAVVKAYEESLHGAIDRLSNVSQGSFSAESSLNETIETLGLDDGHFRSIGEMESLCVQEPYFLPHAKVPSFIRVSPPREYKFLAPGGLSRWESDKGLKITGFTIVTNRSETNQIKALEAVQFIFGLVAEHSSEFSCRYAVVFYDNSGCCVAKIVSPVDRFTLNVGDMRMASLSLNPCQLGPGEYFLSISVHMGDDLELLNTTGRYDLLNRSFCLNVFLPDSMSIISAQLFHSGEWMFSGY